MKKKECAPSLVGRLMVEYMRGEREVLPPSKKRYPRSNSHYDNLLEEE
jgi:hypothetical protein